MDMPDLHGRDPRAVDNGSLHDGASTDSCSGENSQDILGTSRSSKSVFRIDTGIHIIEQVNRTVKMFSNDFSQGNVFPAQVHAFANQAGLHVDKSRAADTDASNFLGGDFRFFERLPDRSNQSLDNNLAAALGLGSQTLGTHVLELPIVDSTEDFRPAKVDPDPVLVLLLLIHVLPTRGLPQGADCRVMLPGDGFTLSKLLVFLLERYEGNTLN
jgi:hypothetical protein